MKSIITILVALIGATTSVYAQGSIAQTTPNPMYVYNNGSSEMVFQPRTHNYAEYHEPLCDVNDYSVPGSHLFHLAPMNNIGFADLSFPGVPLHVFPLGNVVSSDNGPLTSIAIAQDYGKTQRWHCIKFETANLGGYLVYNYSLFQNGGAVPQYGPLSGTPYWVNWDKDPNGLIVDTYLDVYYHYDIENIVTGNTATWITLNNWEIIMVT